MVTREEVPVGAPCWVDLATPEVQAARTFYGTIFGWTSDEPNPDFGGYVNFAKDGDLVAGCVGQQPDDSGPPRWTTYLATVDVRASLDAVEAHGGQILLSAQEVGDLGTMAIVTDPGGSVVGLWEPKEHRGFLRYGEPGTPGWFDMVTRHYDQCVVFYRDAMLWSTHTLSDTPEFRYTMLKVGDDELAGIMDATTFLAEGVPAHWTVVFMVDDTDATVAEVLLLGGAVVHPAMDSPWGRLATVSDPEGAEFALISGDGAVE